LKDKIKDMFYLTDYEVVINPLGDWTGGTDVDAGATNRKLGSDMGTGISGGGLHGKDLSKADVTLNICATLFGTGISCSIGDEYIGKYDYAHYVDLARGVIEKLGGFEKFAEWGLLRTDKYMFN
jgi:S-adenosylmethionine synthetase